MSYEDGCKHGRLTQAEDYGELGRHDTDSPHEFPKETNVTNALSIK